MKAIIRFSLLLLLFSSCYSPQLNCAKYKTGTFEYQTYADGELIKATIVRNDSLEIDYYDEKEPDTSQIRWINNCTYVLKKYNPTTDSEKQRYQMKIISTAANSYTFEFSLVGEHEIKEFTATRVEEEAP